MRICLLLLTIALSAGNLFSQTFKPDKNGYVSDPAFKALLKRKGFVCGAFRDFDGKYYAEVYTRDGLWNYIDLKGNLTNDETPEIFEVSEASVGTIDRLEPEQEGEYSKDRLRSFMMNGKYGVTQGPDTLLAPVYEFINPVGKKALVKIGNNIHLYFQNDRNEWVFSQGYDNIKTHSYLNINYPYFIVSCDGKSGMMNYNGNVILPVLYDQIETLSFARFLAITLGTKKGWVSPEGKVIVPAEYDWIGYDPYKLALLASNRNGYYAEMRMYNTNGKLLSGEYLFTGVQSIGPGNMRYLAVATGNSNDIKTGIYDLRSETFILEPKYFSIASFAYGDPLNARAIVSVKTDGKRQYGYIDANGTEVVKPMYDQAYNYASERAVVTKNGKSGIIDMNGKEVFEIIYDSIFTVNDYSFSYLEKDYAAVKINGKWGMMFDDKKMILPAIYDEIGETGKDLKIREGSLWGIASMDGKVIVPLKYMAIEAYSDGLYRTEKNGNSYMVDLYGNEGIVLVNQYEDFGE